MPQMNKGGKWVFGWCLVGLTGEIRIPPAAFDEYAFQTDEPICFLHGSRRSGGFSVARLEKLDGPGRLLLRRSIGPGSILRDHRIAVPAETGIQPGQRLLAVRGSGYAVLFLTGGPIYEKALKHPDIETFNAP